MKKRQLLAQVLLLGLTSPLFCGPNISGAKVTKPNVVEAPKEIGQEAARAKEIGKEAAKKAAEVARAKEIGKEAAKQAAEAARAKEIVKEAAKKAAEKNTASSDINLSTDAQVEVPQADPNFEPELDLSYTLEGEKLAQSTASQPETRNLSKIAENRINKLKKNAEKQQLKAEEFNKRAENNELTFSDQLGIAKDYVTKKASDTASYLWNNSRADATNAIGNGLSATYNAPGKLVESMGGQKQFITGETGSLRSAASSTYQGAKDGVSYLGRQASNGVNFVGRQATNGVNFAGRQVSQAAENVYHTPGALAKASGLVSDANIATNAYKTTGQALSSAGKAIVEAPGKAYNAAKNFSKTFSETLQAQKQANTKPNSENSLITTDALSDGVQTTNSALTAQEVNLRNNPRVQEKLALKRQQDNISLVEHNAENVRLAQEQMINENIAENAQGKEYTGLQRFGVQARNLLSKTGMKNQGKLDSLFGTEGIKDSAQLDTVNNIIRTNKSTTNEPVTIQPATENNQLIVYNNSQVVDHSSELALRKLNRDQVKNGLGTEAATVENTTSLAQKLPDFNNTNYLTSKLLSNTQEPLEISKELMPETSSFDLNS